MQFGHTLQSRAPAGFAVGFFFSRLPEAVLWGFSPASAGVLGAQRAIETATISAAIN